MISGKRIVLGVTGGIAAYKMAHFVRILKKMGAEVKCVLTPASSDFITPLTLSTLSQNPAYTNLWNKENGEWTNHVELGNWGDLMIIAPLTANTLSKLATGKCDNLLCATYLSAKCPVMVAPAMDLDMYAHPTVEENLETLQKNGNIVLPVEEGFLASGLKGKGRMMEPERIYQAVEDFFLKTESMKGERVLITAGPTYEAIDPVRFVGNRSSGKMGFALANECLKRGANVVLVSGPTNCTLHHPSLHRIDVETAEEMFAAVNHEFPQCDGGIFAAAVSDYRPKNSADKKIKKKSDEMTIEMVKNPDILRSIGATKRESQWLVGFALETNDAVLYGKEKREKKKLDLIVVNTLEDEGAGFGHNTNKVTLIDYNNKITKFELSTKTQVAVEIMTYLKKLKNK